MAVLNASDERYLSIEEVLDKSGLRFTAIPSEAHLALSRLYEKLSITSAGSAARPFVSTVIYPVVSMDELLKRPVFENVGSTATITANGTNTILTVPSGKRLSIYMVNMQRSSGSRTLDKIIITDTSTGDSIDVFKQSAGNHFDTQYFTHPLILDEGDLLRFNVSGGSGDTVWGQHVYYAIEDAF